MSFANRLLVVCLAVCFFAVVPSRAQVYVAQNAAGLANGSSCANALGLSSFNNWTAGVTLNLCGTFTSGAGGQLIHVRGAGTSTSPIRINLSGARLSAPYWSSAGAINAAGESYIIIDGGNTGIIENTENGTGLTYQQSSIGLFLDNCTNCTVQNLTVQNIYKRTSANDLALSSASNVSCIRYFGANQFTINHVTCHDVGWAFNGSGNNATIENSEAYNIDHGVAAGAGTFLAHLYIHNNFFHDFAAWDSPTDSYHHDGVHVFANGSSTDEWNDVEIYNNVFDGNQGACCTTAMVFMQGQIINSFVSHNRIHVKAGLSPMAPIEFGDGHTYSIRETGNSASYNVIVIDNNAALYRVQGSAISIRNQTGFTLTHNLLFGATFDIGFSEGSTLGTVDYNIYEDVLHDFGSNNAWSYQGVSYHSLSTWQSVCGCDAHSTMQSVMQ